MIALKARIRARTVSVVAIDDDDQPVGKPFDVAILEPEGFEGKHGYCATAPFVEGEEQIVFCEDDAVPEGARRCRPADFPKRPGVVNYIGFPDVVPAGFGNSKVDADGKLIPANPKTGRVIGAPVEVDLVP